MQNRRIVDRNFAEAGAQAQPVVETNSISTLHAHVREGRLCAVLADSWLQAYSLPEGMSLLPLEPERRQPIGIVWPEGEPTSAMARALVEAAEEFNSTKLPS